MSSNLPTVIAGDTLRKAVQKYGELKKQRPEAHHSELLQSVSVEFDLSPLQSDFLERQLRGSK